MHIVRIIAQEKEAINFVVVLEGLIEGSWEGF